MVSIPRTSPKHISSTLWQHIIMLLFFPRAMTSLDNYGGVKHCDGSLQEAKNNL